MMQRELNGAANVGFCSGFWDNLFHNYIWAAHPHDIGLMNDTVLLLIDIFRCFKGFKTSDSNS